MSYRPTTATTTCPLKASLSRSLLTHSPSMDPSLLDPDLHLTARSTLQTNLWCLIPQTQVPLPSTLVVYVTKKFMRMTKLCCVRVVVTFGSTECVQDLLKMLSLC